MTYVCEIEKPPKSEVKDNLLYHAGIPVLTGFHKQGLIWRLLAWFQKLPDTEPASAESPTNLVVQADPRVLERFARELYGIELSGHDVEITIVPANRQQDRCRPRLV